MHGAPAQAEPAQKPRCPGADKKDDSGADEPLKEPAAASADTANQIVALMVALPTTPAPSPQPADATATVVNHQAAAVAPVLSPTNVPSANALAVSTQVAVNPALATPNSSALSSPLQDLAQAQAAKTTAEAIVSQATAPALPPVSTSDQSDPATTSNQSATGASQITYSSTGLLSSPAATTTTPAVPVHAVGETIAVEAARIGPAGKSEIVLRLDPPDLGSIKVQIQHDPNGLRIDVIPQKVHSAELLQSQVESLKQRLENSGLGNVQVQIRQDQGQSQSQQNQRQDLWEDVSLDSISAGLKKAGSAWKAAALPGQSAMALIASVDFRA